MQRSFSLAKLTAPVCFLVSIYASLSLAQNTPTAKDCSEIIRALSLLPVNGGQVLIAEGTYVCQAPIILDHDNVSLIGAGHVLLRLADGANSPVIVMGDIATPPQPHKAIRVENIEIDGNRLHQQMECWDGECDSGGTAFIRNNGISVRGLTDSFIQNVSVRAPSSGGVVSEKGCYNLHIDHLTVTDSAFDGFAGYETYNSELGHLDLSRNHSAGISIDIHFDHNLIHDAKLENNGDVGIFMRDSNSNHFKNLAIKESGNHGIFLSNVDDNSTCANDNEFESLSVSSSKGFGFRLNSACADNRLSGTTEFLHNRDGCISEGTSVPLQQVNPILCESLWRL